MSSQAIRWVTVRPTPVPRPLGKSSHGEITARMSCWDRPRLDCVYMDSSPAHAGCVDVDKVQRSIDQALTFRSSPLRRAELEELGAVLSRHRDALLPGAQEHVDNMWRGSLEWYRSRSTLDRVASSGGYLLGSAVLGDITHVMQLARDCRWLLELHLAAERAAGHDGA
ncbi:DUF6415 family natural product biosynthesis protein [Streptomyces roseifaciens]